MKLKNIFVLMSFVSIFISCNDNEQVSNSNVENSNIESKSLTKVSNMELFQVFFDSSNSNYREVLMNMPVSIDELDLQRATLVTYSWNHARLYQVPLKNSEKIKASVFAVGDRKISLILEETDNANIIKRSNGKLLLVADKFSNNFKDYGLIDYLRDEFLAVFAKCDCHGEESLCNHKYDRMENCAKYSYKECYACGNDVCTQDIRCDHARSLTGPAWTLGLMASCGLAQIA